MIFSKDKNGKPAISREKRARKFDIFERPKRENLSRLPKRARKFDIFERSEGADLIFFTDEMRKFV